MRELAYRYDFGAGDVAAALACYREHGFAIVRGLLPADVVADLRRAVDEVLGDPPPSYGQNRTTPEFVERSPLALRFLDAKGFVALYEALHGTSALTIHRSFAVLKNAGSSPVAWHRDYHHRESAIPTEPDQFLDPSDHGLRLLWYLDGSYPDEGGLWLIPDSHRDDWAGLEGFSFCDGRKSFHRLGTKPAHYDGFDAPEMLPLHIDPGDGLLYDLKLYHGAAPQPEGLRRACAMLLRPTEPALDVPWAQPASSLRFVETIPEHLRRYVVNYVGIDYGWRPAGASRPRR
jgi:ectoine hydroxylase-related dioxygenase (phytanoyl-CoA dioxygenase family)